MSFQIPRWDSEMRFVTKFGENQPLQSCRKVVWITTRKKNSRAGLIPAPILTKMGRSRQKFPERCHPLTCPRDLVGIGCVLLDLFRKDWFFGPKSQYNIGFQPTTIVILLLYLTQYYRFASKHQLMCDLQYYTLNAQNALLWHEYSTRPEMIVPRIHCVWDTLSQAMPDFHEVLLQFIDVVKLISVANVSMHTSRPKEDILAFNTTREYTHN